MDKSIVAAIRNPVRSALAVAILCCPLMGCGGEKEKSAEDVEKGRQDHIKQSQREREEG